MATKKPRYTKAGVIYKADRELLKQGWPETIEPGGKPVQAKAAPSESVAAGGTGQARHQLPTPDPMKRKGRC